MGSRLLTLAVFVALAGVCSIVLLWPTLLVLEISACGTGEVLMCAPVNQGDTCVMSFIHSVNKRPVFDTWRFEADHIVIVKSRFDAFGAGMPESSTDEGTLAVLDDGWLEWTVNRPVPDLIVRVGRVANHVLLLKGREVPLANLAEPGRALRFKVRRVSRFFSIKERCVR